MILSRLVLAAMLAAIAACATPPAPSAGPEYFVTRHLQKATGEDPGLTEQGRACAAMLSQRLAGERIGAIYSSRARRAQETAAPLAALLGIAPILYDPADTPGLIARLRGERGAVLVVGHSNTVPDIVAGLGGERPAPIADDRYGDLWSVSGSPARTVQNRLQRC
ncbi:SixA phosphatase family protein [Allosphingosinicella sp.]|jgi:hypothetical protein|uniref:SixA phosphatase family protein n=1 Tax=Allosphingosinicella sp. TaxID=2823234 RepID=UPI002F25C71D